jgi:ABC-type dipeptide/oligopeptide/nickel transport system permease component
LRSLSVVPVLVLGVALVVIATEGFGLPPFRQVLGLAGGGAVLAIYLLPMLTLAFGDGLLGDVMRTVEAETTRTTTQPWYRAAKARGVPLRRHLTRRLLPPTTAVLASKAAYLVSGSVVVEYVFGWQGLGYLMLNALVQAGPKDYALVLAATTLMVGIVVLLDLASTVVTLAADPQRREG